jgi:hypothetical protein
MPTKTEALLEEETKVTPEKEVPQEQEKELDIDTSALQEEVRSTVSKQIVSDMVTKLKGEAPSDEDVPVWEKEGRNPKSYKEIAEYAVTQFDRRQTEKEKEITRQEKLQHEAETRNQEEALKTQNQIWDQEIAFLQENNLMPKIVDKNSKDDEGVKAARDLFEKAINLVKEGKLPSKSLIAAYYQSTPKPKAEPPVFGRKNAGPVGEVGEPGYTYGEIHGSKSFQDILGNQ